MKEKLSGIYKLTNKLDGKVYIGQSKDIKKRWRSYGWTNKGAANPHLRNALKQHGLEGFIFEILELLEGKEFKDDREKFWIKEFKSNNKDFGYNKTEGGDGTISEESRLRMSETRKRLYTGKNAYWYGRNHTEDTKKKISVAKSNGNSFMFGKKGKDCPNSKKIVCLETGIIYNSVKEAGEAIGRNPVTISSSIKRGIRCKKLHWKWVKEEIK